MRASPSSLKMYRIAVGFQLQRVIFAAFRFLPREMISFVFQENQTQMAPEKCPAERDLILEAPSLLIEMIHPRIEFRVCFSSRRLAEGVNKNSLRRLIISKSLSSCTHVHRFPN